MHGRCTSIPSAIAPKLIQQTRSGRTGLKCSIRGWIFYTPKKQLKEIFMALIVEDGTAVANAESYASVAFADAYWPLQGGNSDWEGASTADKEAALRRATTYIETHFDFYENSLATTQALTYPIKLVYHPITGRQLGGTGILPNTLIVATVELASLYIADSFADPDNSVVSEEKIGDSTFKYAGAQTNQSLERIGYLLNGIARNRANTLQLVRS